MAEKLATREVIRVNGKPHVRVIDVETGEPLSDLSGYKMLEQGEDLNLSFIPGKPNPRTEDFLEEEEEESIFRRGEGGDGGDNGFLQGTPSDNRFGYVNKPDWLSHVGLLPGMPGLMGKAINAAINANNITAINKARVAIGVPELSAIEATKGVLKDRKGYIGDIVVGDEQYAVGFEAMTEDNRTTLTPDEAIRRSQTIGLAPRLATPKEIEIAEVQNAVVQAEESKGLLGGIKGIGSKIIDRALGRETEFPDVPDLPTVDVAPTGTGPIESVERSPVGPPGRSITPGAGLANLAPNGLGDVRDNLTGKGRGAVPIGDLVKAADLAAKTALGPGFSISMESGTYNPERQAKIDAKLADLAQRGISPSSKIGKAELRAAGQIGSTRHNHGQALDMDVIDPQGNRVTDQASLDALAAEFGRQGISSMGYGVGYMGEGRFHVDTHVNKASTWGGMPQQMRDNFLAERTPVGILPFDNVPTPTPANPVDPAMVSMETTSSTLPSTVTAFDRTTPSNPRTANAFDSLLNSANQSIGFQRNQEQLDMVSRTIAGELGSKTIQGILSRDPVAIEAARKEIAAITSTIDNRANSTRFSSLGNPYEGVLASSQYNANRPQNLPTTNRNFDLIGDFIKEAITDMDKGINPSPVPNATHYTATYTNPNWEAHSMGQPITVGEHRFSTVRIPGTNVPEYRKALPEEGPIPTFNTDPLSSNFGTGLVNNFAPDERSNQRSTSSGGLAGSIAGVTSGKKSEASTPTGATASRSTASVTGTRSTGRGGIGVSAPSKAASNTVGGGVSGALSNAFGSGFGSQDLAGATQEVGGTETARSAASSFGGFSAGSLAGSASGAGSGFGTSNGVSGGSFSGGVFGGTGTKGNASMREGVLGARGQNIPAGDLPGKNLGIQAPAAGKAIDFESTISSTANTAGFAGPTTGGLFGGFKGAGSIAGAIAGTKADPNDETGTEKSKDDKSSSAGSKSGGNGSKSSGSTTGGLFSGLSGLFGGGFSSGGISKGSFPSAPAASSGKTSSGVGGISGFGSGKTGSKAEASRGGGGVSSGGTGLY